MAATNNTQFNMYGRARGGYSWSADYAWFDMQVYAYNTGSWPWAASFNEMCEGSNGVAGQWQIMLWNLVSVGMQGAFGSTVTYSNADSFNSRCKNFGDAAFGVGDTTWAIPLRYDYDLGGNHVRKYVCVNPRISIFNFNHRSCSTHLENGNDSGNSPVASDQLDVVNQRFYNWTASGIPTVWGGDFNLSPQRNGDPPRPGFQALMGPSRWTLSYFFAIFGNNHFEAGSYYPTYPNGSYPADYYQKLDYSGFSYPVFHQTGDPMFSWSGYVPYCGCQYDGGRISDHALMRVFVST